MARNVVLDPLSGTSLRITPKFGATSLATATGFTIQHDGKHYLATNWHVVTGRNADTLKCLDPNAAIPDRLIVSFHSAGRLGEWKNLEIPLHDDDGTNSWIEHPLGRAVDLALLPIASDPEIQFYPIDLALANVDLIPAPAMTVCVIGYPLGLDAGGNWPIWKTGHIASEPDIDYEGKPVFLIDATTRSGMSGSPVIIRLNGGFATKGGGYMLAGGVTTKFVGVYSGRIHENSEVGRVWHPFLINEILEQRLRFDDVSGRVAPARNAPCPCGKAERFKDCCGRL
jgi:hypothetical protein